MLCTLPFHSAAFIGRAISLRPSRKGLSRQERAGPGPPHFSDQRWFDAPVQAWRDSAVSLGACWPVHLGASSPVPTPVFFMREIAFHRLDRPPAQFPWLGSLSIKNGLSGYNLPQWACGQQYNLLLVFGPCLLPSTVPTQGGELSEFGLAVLCGTATHPAQDVAVGNQACPAHNMQL